MEITTLFIGLATGLIAGFTAQYLINKFGLKAKRQSIIDDAHKEAEVIKKNKLLEVKEKYGCMRIYDWMKNYMDVPADITNIVRYYEQESLRTCPVCGNRKLPKHDMCVACARRYEEMAKGVADDEMLP